MDLSRLDASAAALGCTVDQLVAILREQEYAAIAPEARAAKAQEQAADAARMESVPADASSRVAARRAGARAVSSTPPLCNRCGRTRSQREIAYPIGWSPAPQPFGEELSEDEVPICCGRSIELGTDEDKAYREIECLRWAKRSGWTPIPDPPVDPRCKFCKRLRFVECQRDVEAGSMDDKAARALECSMAAADA